MKSQVLPEWDSIQRGYDVLFIDPTTLAQADNNPPTPGSETGVRQYVFNMEATVPIKGKSNLLIPSQCTGSFLNSFAENTSTDTDLIQASSDITTALSQSITVADPVGQLFSFGESSATQTRQKTVADRSVTLSTTQATYQYYQLQIPNWDGHAGSQTMPALASDFLSAVKNLSSASDVAANVIALYGTHFPTSMMVGGIAYLQFQFDQSALSSLTSTNTSLQANGSAAFDVVKVGGSISSSQGISESYKQAVSNQLQTMNFVGGTESGSVQQWEPTVPSSPSPIQLTLQPLYSLPQLATELGGSDAPQLGYLRSGIDSYLMGGQQLMNSVLNYGDTIVLQPVSGLTADGTTLLSPQPGVNDGTAPKSNVPSALASPPTSEQQLVDLAPGGTQLNAGVDGLSPVQPGQSTPFLLTLVNPDPSAPAGGEVDCTQPICFALTNSASPQWLLDSEAGGAWNQAVVGLSTNPVTAATTQWMMYPLSSPSQPVLATQTAYATLAHEQGLASNANFLTHGDVVSIYRMEKSNGANQQGFIQAVPGRPIVSKGSYTQSAISGNSCFFRILLVSKSAM